MKPNVPPTPIQQTAQPTSQPAVKPTAQPTVQSANTGTGYGIDYAEPKNPYHSTPPLPTQKSGSAVLNSSPQTAQTTTQAKPTPVVSNSQSVNQNLLTGPHIETKAPPLPGEEVPPMTEKKWIQPVNHPIDQPPAERSAGARDIIETKRGEVLQTTKNLPAYNENLKNNNKTEPAPLVKQDQLVQSAKSASHVQQASEQKTEIKKMDLNKEKWWENKDKWWEKEQAQQPAAEGSSIANRPKLDPNKFKKGQDPFATSQAMKIKPTDPFASSQAMKIKPTDPFATSKVLDGKYESKPVVVSGEQTTQYGGNEEDLMRRAAANKKANRIERERIEAEERARAQAQSDAETAMFVNTMVGVGMNAAIHHYDKPKVVSGGGGGGRPADVYRRGYADEKYGSGSYNTPHSKILEGAKGMTGGGSAGWQ